MTCVTKQKALQAMEPDFYHDMYTTRTRENREESYAYFLTDTEAETIRAALQPPDPAIYNWLNAHIKPEDLKTHPEWIELKRLLGVQDAM